VRSRAANDRENAREAKRREPKERAYVVRLEWASKIAYCDVAVMASDLPSAITKAHEDCDYDLQDDYDDGGETYVGAVALLPNMEAAEQCANDRSLWDHHHLALPRDAQDPQQQVFELREQIAFLRAALGNAHRALAQTRTGTLEPVQIDNELNKAAFVLANVH